MVQRALLDRDLKHVHARRVEGDVRQNHRPCSAPSSSSSSATLPSSPPALSSSAASAPLTTLSSPSSLPCWPLEPPPPGPPHPLPHADEIFLDVVERLNLLVAADGTSRFVCKHPGCDREYASRDAVRKPCRLRRTGCAAAGAMHRGVADLLHMAQGYAAVRGVAAACAAVSMVQVAIVTSASAPACQRGNGTTFALAQSRSHPCRIEMGVHIA